MMTARRKALAVLTIEKEGVIYEYTVVSGSYDKNHKAN